MTDEPEETQAQIEGRILGLSAYEVLLLDGAYAVVELLNDSLEKNGSPHRWNVLGNSDPRRVKNRKAMET